jgi:AcrR family transcriptional regulator
MVLGSGPSTRIAEIAEQAGVSKGALQHHFDSKSDLLAAVVAAGWDELVEHSAPAVHASHPPTDRIGALVRATWDSFRRPACQAAFMISSDPNLEPELADRLAPIFESARRRLDDSWSLTFDDLDVSVEQTVRARRFVRSHLLGMLVQRQLPSEEPVPDDELSTLCAATLQILMAPEPR